MSDFAAYLGEIRMFAGDYAPQGWMFCEGQVLPVAGNEYLAKVLDNRFGGGDSEFRLPDLRGRLPVGQGHGAGLSSYAMGETGGAEAVTLTERELPIHHHVFYGTPNPGTSAQAGGKVVAQASQIDLYIEAPQTTNLSNGAVLAVGGGGAHNNLMPFVCIAYIICIEGLLPSQS